MNKLLSIIYSIVEFVNSFISYALGGLKVTFKVTKKYSNSQLFMKMLIVVFLTTILITRTFAWFYNEYISYGSIFQVGNIDHVVVQYDSSGTVITDPGETQTMIFEPNISTVTSGSRYISVENTGTLDMEYAITFLLDGTTADAGSLYYRLYEITTEVDAAITDATYNTPIKAYVRDNPIDPGIESDSNNPIANMSTIGNFNYKDAIRIEGSTPDPDTRYYRLDYGMYAGTNSALFTGKAIAVQTNVYATQLGQLVETNGTGETIVVTNETEFRAAIDSSKAGDTIQLANDITVNGNVDFYKKLNVDTAGYMLAVTGDLVYDFVDTGNFTIDVTETGTLEIGGNFVLNTPKNNVVLLGENSGFDIFVAGTFTVNALQDGEENGVLFDNVRIVKNKTTNIPVDLTVLSNTRLTIGADVELGYVTANNGATNIEVINSGTILQLQLQAMTLLTTFTKPQIYIYNLNTITGPVNSSSILLPSNATPYLSPTQGNTLIIKGPDSTDITVEGSEYFDQGDISHTDDDGTVVPIPGENNSYIVYLKEESHTVQGVLTNYFTRQSSPDVSADIAEIEKLVIRTVNAQYMDNVDFDYIKSSALPNIWYLNIEDARVRDGTVLNKIKDNALYGKATLKEIILPSTADTIGYGAFYGIELGKIPVSILDPFTFLTIPSNISVIGDYAFNSAKYVRFEGINPPNISTNTFNNGQDGTKIFVNEVFINTYRNKTNFYPQYIYREAELSDSRLYFVYPYQSGLGISLSINPAVGGTNITVPSNLYLNSYNLDVKAIGESAYRHVPIDPAGATLSLPVKVTAIESYAFYGKDIISANINNVTKFGDYSFYGTGLPTLNLQSANIIGKYAFASNYDLYEIRFYDVSLIDDYAFYETPSVVRAYFNSVNTINVLNTTMMNFTVGTNAIFGSWGSYIDGRLRVFVPAGTEASGKTYLSLYKNKFSGNEKYVFETGSLVGDYYYLAVPHNLYEYTVKNVTYNNASGTPVDGYEIISYQGNDLSNSYQIPETLTVAALTKPVIGIGQNAYINSEITAGNKVNLSNTNLLKLGYESFKNHDINSIIASNVVEIGDSAFANSSLVTAEFPSLKKLGNSALMSIPTLRKLNLGNVDTIGNTALAGADYLYQLYFTNANSNITLGSSPFTNLGQYTNGRLRIYVPATDAQVDYYKTVFIDNAKYVYKTGEISGSYTENGFDIGDYAVRYVTLTDKDLATKNGVEIIDYHGDQLTSSYVIPSTLTYNSISYPVISIGREAYINADVAELNYFDITGSEIISIEKAAFQDADYIDEVILPGLVNLKINALFNTSIRKGDFPSLNSIAGGALGNCYNLNVLNLGKVQAMSAYAVTNAEKLYQINFNAIGESFTFAANAFLGVGTQTSGRLRIYVTDANGISGNPYYELYQNSLGSNYSNKIYPKGSLVGTYYPLGVPYDIGIYSVRVKTIPDYLDNPTTGFEIIEYHGSDLSDTYNLPGEITAGVNTYNVISIGNYAYYHTSTIASTRIDEINNNIISIGDYAFQNNQAFALIEMNSLVSIGDYAFDNNNLEVIDFPYLEVTGNYSFNSNSNLFRANLGRVHTIGNYAFADNSSVQDLRFSNTSGSSTTIAISIGTDAFANVGSLIGTRFRVYVPDGTGTSGLKYVTMYKNTLPSSMSAYIYVDGEVKGSYILNPFGIDIGEYTVRSVTLTNSTAQVVTGLEIIEYHGANITDSYDIPATFDIDGTPVAVISIGENAYRHVAVAPSNNWTLDLPTTVFNIGNYAFEGRNIATLSGNDIAEIGSYAFANVTLLQSISFANAVNIRDHAFYNIPTLQTVSVGSGTLVIEDYAFYVSGVNQLTSFYIEAPIPPTITATTLPAPGNLTVYVAWDSRSAYLGNSIWGDYNIIRLRTAYSGIYLYDFIYGDEIIITGFTGTNSTLDIPDVFTLDSVDYNVVAIAEGAFLSATNTRTLILPLYMREIPDDIFAGNTAVRAIQVDPNNPYFSSNGDVLFDKSGQTLLAYPNDFVASTYTVPSGTKVIAANAFNNCTRLTTITFNSDLAVISKNAFQNNTKTNRFIFTGTTVPYITSTKVFPMLTGLDITVPTASLSLYQGNYALQRYSTYIHD